MKKLPGKGFMFIPLQWIIGLLDWKIIHGSFIAKNEPNGMVGGAMI